MHGPTNETVADLLREWDPIGVYRHEPLAPEGEYDLYVGEVGSAVARGKSVDEVAALLGRIETDRMGFTAPNEANNRRIAQALVDTVGPEPQAQA